MGMKSIKEIISSKRLFYGIDISNLPLLDYIWKEKFKNYSAFCEIDAIERNILVLKPANGVIKNEIYMKKDQIVREINKYFKKEFIKDIKFTM